MAQTIARLLFVPRLCAIFLIVALSVPMAGPALAAQSADYAVSGGWFYSQTGGGLGNGYAVRDLGTDANGNPIKFWTEFQRYGGVTTLGYPVGEPYVGSDGFTYQPFQRALLQWRPELGQALLANTFELLQSSGKDDWLAAQGVPREIADDGSGGNYTKAVATRLGWLTNDAIKAKFLANPNPAAISNWSTDTAIQLYGLPMSQPTQEGPFIVQRFERISFQDWTSSVAGMPPVGSVVGILGGDLLKASGLIPPAAVITLLPNATGPTQAAPAPTPVPTAAPATPAYPWHVATITTAPNCGFTYFSGQTINASGAGVNGMAIKSWNDYGNVAIVGSHNNNGMDGYFDRPFGSGILPGKWYLQVVDGAGNPASAVVTVTFNSTCDPNAGGVQQANVIFQSS